MADNPQTLTAILSALAQNFRPEVVRQVNRKSVLLHTLPVKPGFGKNVPIDIELSGAVSESFSDGAEAANFGSDAVAPGTLSWLPHRANFKVTDLAIAAAASSRSPEELMALYGRNVVNAMSALASTLNAAYYAQLVLAMDDDNTYAGIDRSDGSYALWRSNVIDPGSLTAPTLALIRNDLANTIYSACGSVPDLAFCSPAVFLKLASLFTELRRYVQPVTSVSTAKGNVLLDGSVGAIEFEGCTFIKDKDCTANAIYYVNSEHVHIEYLPQGPVEMGDAGQDVGIDDGFGPVPLGARFYVLGRTGAYRKASAQVFSQLVCDRPNACGVRLNVSTT